jgi:hypothetical protein
LRPDNALVVRAGKVESGRHLPLDNNCLLSKLALRLRPTAQSLTPGMSGMVTIGVLNVVGKRLVRAARHLPIWTPNNCSLLPEYATCEPSSMREVTA